MPSDERVPDVALSSARLRGVDIVVAPEPAALAAGLVAHRLRGAVRRRGAASLALSVGSTAPSMISALVLDEVPWRKVTVWQVDERVAPDGHADRNAIQLDEIPCRVKAMPVTSRDLRAAARRYADSLPDRFDVVHLGLGSDGHTASWPPGADAIVNSSRPVELVRGFHGHDRMTLTRRVVNGARSRIVVATGSSKRAVVERWLLLDRTLPITAVRHSGTRVFLDPAAAPSAGDAQ